jgi:hypothetical protein
MVHANIIAATAAESSAARDSDCWTLVFAAAGLDSKERVEVSNG